LHSLALGDTRKPRDNESLSTVYGGKESCDGKTLMPLSTNQLRARLKTIDDIICAAMVEQVMDPANVYEFESLRLSHADVIKILQLTREVIK
jgi:hypothetical protein